MGKARSLSPLGEKAAVPAALLAPLGAVVAALMWLGLDR
jgi:hypothetical protein